MISRRQFCITAAATGAAAITGCRLGTTTVSAPGSARITALPGAAPTTSMAPGIHDLGPGRFDRNCWLVVPADYTPTRAWPLTLFFRGAITPAREYLDHFRPLADELGLIILAPEANSRTWDLVLGGFGPDVAFINQALVATYRAVHVDATRICSSGFSDGGSYSLSLGVSNGDVLTRVAAYSPGFIQAETQRGKPEFFITHGTSDQVLSIDTTRYMVEQLRVAGYSVDYREWDGSHAVSLSLARASFEWMVRPSTSAPTG